VVAVPERKDLGRTGIEILRAWLGLTTRERVAYLTHLLESPLPADVDQTARHWLACTQGSGHKAGLNFGDCFAYSCFAISGLEWRE
jgi:uncharacterized protein with PIN domain